MISEICFIFSVFILAIYVLLSGTNANIQVLPYENGSKSIIIENDSLRMNIFLNWKLFVNSLIYKPQNLELIQKEYLIPLVGIENRWFLYNSGFGLREFKIHRGK